MGKQYSSAQFLLTLHLQAHAGILIFCLPHSQSNFGWVGRQCWFIIYAATLYFFYINTGIPAQNAAAYRFRRGLSNTLKNSRAALKWAPTALAATVLFMWPVVSRDLFYGSPVRCQPWPRLYLCSGSGSVASGGEARLIAGFLSLVLLLPFFIEKSRHFFINRKEFVVYVQFIGCSLCPIYCA